MSTLPNLTKTLLLSLSFLLLTGCNNNSQTDTRVNSVSSISSSPIIPSQANLTSPTSGNQITSSQVNSAPSTSSSQTTSPQITVTLEDTKGLKNLVLTVDKTTLNRDENTTVKVIARYEDGTSKDLTDKVEWIVNPKGSVAVTQKTLIAKKDNQTTMQAKLGDMLSNSMNLNITWTVNGHVLPAEPDETLNNSTLLGIDSNSNGVRDDVERWIYETYDEYIPCHYEDYDHIMPDGSIFEASREVCEETAIPYHPIVRATAMQHARAVQIIIQEPKKAKVNKTYKILDAAQDCEITINVSHKKRIYQGKEYQAIQKSSFKEGNGLVAKLFNTGQRARAYSEYNYNLSGGVYRLTTNEEALEQCSQEVKELLQELK